MDNSNPNTSESEVETKPDVQPESQTEIQPVPETGPSSYVNEKIRHAYDRAKVGFRNANDYYLRSPRLQKITYQGKFLPAFWTVTAIFSLLVNIVLIVIFISYGRNFFELKSLVGDGLINGMSNNLALMDKAHIVTTVPFQTTVQLKDDIPLVFDLPINQNSLLSLTQDTRINGAVIYLNNTPVTTDLTLPAGTPIQARFNITIPVSQSIPVDLTVPVSLLVPLDVPVDQTDLHQSIVGLQDAIEPYKTVIGSAFNSPEEISFCKPWWLGWMCDIYFGKP